MWKKWEIHPNCQYGVLLSSHHIHWVWFRFNLNRRDFRCTVMRDWFGITLIRGGTGWRVYWHLLKRNFQSKFQRTPPRGRIKQSMPKRQMQSQLLQLGPEGPSISQLVCEITLISLVWNGQFWKNWGHRVTLHNCIKPDWDVEFCRSPNTPQWDSLIFVLTS